MQHPKNQTIQNDSQNNRVNYQLIDPMFQIVLATWPQYMFKWQTTFPEFIA